MSKLMKRYETKLETANASEIVAILDMKLNATSPERVADYISFGLDNLKSVEERIDDAIANLKQVKEDAKSQADIIKIGVAKWLNESGVEKLLGDIVSSVKVKQPPLKIELKVTNEEALINAGYFKTVLDKTAVKKAIQNGVDVEGANIETTHLEDSITVYRRKKKC